MIRNGEMVCLTSLLLLSTIIFLYVPDVEVEAAGAPAVTISIDQKQQTAQVAPGDSGTLLYTGEVSVEVPWSPRTQSLMVALSYDAMGWVASGTSTLMFTSQVTVQPFSCTVKVPPMTSSTVTGQLTVSGRWEYQPGVSGGSVPPATSIILIEQYYSHSFVSENLYVEAVQEDRLEVEIEVKNEGNGLDEIYLEADDGGSSEDGRFYFDLSSNDLTIPESSVGSVVLFITTDGAPIGRYQITIISGSLVAAEGNGSDEKGRMDVHVEVVRERSTEGDEPSDEDPPDEEDPPVTPPAEEEEDGSGPDILPEPEADPPEDLSPEPYDEGDSSPSALVIATIVIIAILVLAGVPAVIIYVRAKRID